MSLLSEALKAFQLPFDPSYLLIGLIVLIGGAAIIAIPFILSNQRGLVEGPAHASAASMSAAGHRSHTSA